MDGWIQHGARAATAGPCCSCQQGSPRKLRDDPGAHGNEQGAGKCRTERGKKMTRAVGMAWQRWAGKAWQNKAVVGKQPADEMAGTGRAAKTPADDLAGTGLAVNNSRPTIQPAQALQ